MQRARSQPVIFIAIIVAIFFFIDPFGIFSPRPVPRARVSLEQINQVATFLTERASAPSAYLVSLFSRYDIVFVGETGFAHEQVQLIADVLPALDRAGVQMLGFQHALRSDQAEIDELLTANTFDEQKAERLLFNSLVILGYQEYVEIFRSAWEINRSKSEDEKPFRIIGLTVQIDYQEINQAEEDDAEALQRALATGVPDTYMAETVRREIIDAGERALVFTQLEHAFTQYHDYGYEQAMTEAGFAEQGRMGGIVEALAPGRSATVMMHGPIQEPRNRQTGSTYPAGGAIDRALSSLPEGRRRYGFGVEGTPVGSLIVESSRYGQGYEEPLSLDQFVDGYITLDPIAELDPLTPIPDFVNEGNIVEARERFPVQTSEAATVEQLNLSIAEMAENWAKMFAEFD